MSALFNQTNIAPNTTNFISRSEVIQGISTLAGDLSGVNFSTFFNQPNPIVSSLTVNGSGLISGASGLVVRDSVTVSTAKLQYNTSNQFVLADLLTNYASLGTSAVYAQGGGINGGATRVQLTPSQIAGRTSVGVVQPLATYTSTAPANQWQLTNVSTINGIPPNTSGTTFTNLSGVNLTTSGMLTSPQIVSVSSINGSQYAGVVQGTYIASTTPSVATGVPTVALLISCPAGTLKTNEAFLYDVPILMGAFPPSPTNFQLLFGVRLGGNGQINYSLPYWIAANSVAPVSLNFTGIANTNTASVAAQTIEVIVLHNAGSTWTAPFSNPPSGGGVNTWSLKLVD